MMYPYITLTDETEIVHSGLKEEAGKPFVEVHFERPTEHGFCSARCRIPEYTWLFNYGFSQDEIGFFVEFLKNNAHLPFRFAAQGGCPLCLACSFLVLTAFTSGPMKK